MKLIHEIDWFLRKCQSLIESDSDKSDMMDSPCPLPAFLLSDCGDYAKQSDTCPPLSFFIEEYGWLIVFNSQPCNGEDAPTFWLIIFAAEWVFYAWRGIEENAVARFGKHYKKTRIWKMKTYLGVEDWNYLRLF